MVKLDGVNDRTAAEKIIGQYVFVDEQSLKRPEKGTYFVDDVIECEVWSTEGRLIGKVEEVYKMAGHDMWAVRNGEKLHMIPAAKEFVKNVDIKNRKILVQLIEGLIEE